jgi:hypothetical protein
VTYCVPIYLYITLYYYIIYAIPIGRTTVWRIVVLGEQHIYTYVRTYIYTHDIEHTRITRKII